jgi:hypothetical protein
VAVFAFVVVLFLPAACSWLLQLVPVNNVKNQNFFGKKSCQLLF